MLLWDFIKTDLHHRYFPRNCPTFFAIFICLVSQIITVLRGLLTKALIVFHVETTRKQPFPRRFNVEHMWCVRGTAQAQLSTVTGKIL